MNDTPPLPLHDQRTLQSQNTKQEGTGIIIINNIEFVKQKINPVGIPG